MDGRRLRETGMRKMGEVGETSGRVCTATVLLLFEGYNHDCGAPPSSFPGPRYAPPAAKSNEMISTEISYMLSLLSFNSTIVKQNSIKYMSLTVSNRSSSRVITMEQQHFSANMCMQTSGG